LLGDSPPPRARARPHDQFRRGRARSLSEIAREVDAITAARLAEYLEARRFGQFTVVTIGPEHAASQTDAPRSAAAGKAAR
jgi:hypothetical protein